MGDDRDQCLHYVHRWHTGQDDVLVPLHSMERYIMSTFAAKVNTFRDSSNPDFRPFYHDFMEDEGNERKFADAHSFMSRTRLSLRRVLGCGHFILCVLHMKYNNLEAMYGENWPCLELWQRHKEDLFAKDLLNPDAPCDPEAVYGWMQGFYNELFQTSVPMDQFWEATRIPYTLLEFTAPCVRNTDMLSQEFLRNYQEFLVFHLHNMHEFGFLTGEFLQQYYRLIRKEGEPPTAYITRSQATYIKFTATITYTTKTLITAVETSKIVTVVSSGAGQTAKSLKSISNALTDCTRRHNHNHKQSPDNKTTLIGKPREASRSYWHRTEEMAAGRWQYVSDSITVKVIGQHWRLGCNGCPSGTRRWITRTGKRRTCKWVTIRRTVLVRRIFWRTFRVNRVNRRKQVKPKKN